MRPSKEKMHANTSIFDPSFVYRQDGYELSYKIAGIFYSIARHLSSIFPQGGAPPCGDPFGQQRCLHFQNLTTTVSPMIRIDPASG